VAHPVHEFVKASPGPTGQRVNGMPQVVKVFFRQRRIRGAVTSATRERAQARHQVNPDTAS